MPILTNDMLRTVMPGPGRERIELRDEGKGSVPGLIFRVTRASVRSWSVRYLNAGGGHRRKTIGNFPSTGLAAARIAARKLQGSIADKVDVVGVEKHARAEAARRRLNTVTGLAEAYFDAAALGLHKGSDAKPKRESTMAEERRVYDKHVEPHFGGTAVADMNRDAIETFVARISRKAPSTGRAVRNIVRQMLSYAVRKRLMDHNPAIGVTAAKATPRDRILSDVELRALWSAMEKPGDFEAVKLSAEMSLALRVALVTLQRGGEVVGMRRSEIDRAGRKWTIPASRMKGKRPHVVPLSDLALKLIDEADETIGGSEFVFQSPRSGSAMDRRAFTRAMARLVKAIGIERASPHDFRRAGATNITGERIGIPRFIVSQVLGHAGDTGGAATVTGQHYDLNDYLVEKRRALDAWAALLRAIVDGKERPDNVVALAQAG